MAAKARPELEIPHRMAQPYPPAPGTPERAYPVGERAAGDGPRGMSDADWSTKPTGEVRMALPDGNRTTHEFASPVRGPLRDAPTEIRDPSTVIRDAQTEELAGGRHRSTELALREPSYPVVLSPSPGAERAASPKNHTPRHRRPFQSRQARFGASGIGLTVAVGLVGTVLILQHSPDVQGTGQASPGGTGPPAATADAIIPDQVGDPATNDASLAATSVPPTAARRPAAVPRAPVTSASPTRRPAPAPTTCTTGGGGGGVPAADDPGDDPTPTDDPSDDASATPTPRSSPVPSPTARPAPTGNCPPA
jgi:hypothetical protein